MPYIRVGDLDVYYEAHGEGDSLLLLHGLLGSIESDWRRFIPPLSEHYRVIAVDLRGHGRTSNPVGKLRNVLFRNDLIGLLDALQLDSCILCGYSLGGYIGLIAGLEQPGRIRSLIMHASKMFWDKYVVESMIARLEPDRILAKAPRFAEQLQHLHGEEKWRVLLSEAAGFIRTMPSEVITLEAAKCVDFPMLVSVGDKDELVPTDEATRFHSVLPKGELLVMPNTRHALESVRCEVFIPALDDFFKRTSKYEQS